MAVEPGSVTALLTLGEFELAAGRADPARAAFRAALRLDPSNRFAIAQLQRLDRAAPR